MLYIKIFQSDPYAPITLPRAAYMVQHYSKRAIGGPKDATIRVKADTAILGTLRSYVDYGIHIINDWGQIVWWGYIENVSISNTTGEAQIICAGWWKRLQTRYYSDSTGQFAFMDTSADKQSFSESADIKRVCGAFYHPSDSWTITSIGVNLYMVGSRVDYVQMQVLADSGISLGDGYTYPNTASTLSTTTSNIAGVTIGKNGGYFQYDLTTPLTYNGTLKWIDLMATSTFDATNYYQVGVNTKKDYSYGKLRWYKDLTWHLGTSNGPAGNGPEGWMLFKLIGTLPTSTQIYNIINSTGFYSGIDVMTASGVSSCQYREGKEKCDVLVEDLAKTGTSSSIRYLIDISPYKRVRIYTEPVATIGDYWKLTGATKIGYSTENLANKVSAIYTTQKGASTSGTQAQTAWQENTDSQTRYGIREQIISIKDTDQTAAENYVATALAQMAYPSTKVEWDMGSKVQIYSPYGGRVRPDTCPVGYWARITDSVQTYLDSPFLKAANVIFVEEAEYDAEADSYTPTPRGSESDWQMYTFSG